jgi:uncharacterized membrane protein HdeD (DUF308 family)
MAGLLMVIHFARKRKLKISWWQWMLTLLGFLYVVFVLAVIVAFISEGTPKGALVMGLILGILAVIWGILLARFVFLRAAKK